MDFTHPFFVEVLNSFKKQMGVLGYDLIFFSNEKFISGGDYFSRCLHFHVDGSVIISGQKMENTIQELDMSSIPCIGVDLELKGKKSGYVMSDNFKISSKVVEHFYLLGYRDLGFIGSTADSSISNQREEGYIKAIGCDDIEACKYTSPKLTTIRQNKERLGVFAAHMLFDLINNQSEGGYFVVDPALVVRESCGSQYFLSAHVFDHFDSRIFIERVSRIDSDNQMRLATDIQIQESVCAHQLAENVHPRYNRLRKGIEYDLLVAIILGTYTVQDDFVYENVLVMPAWNTKQNKAHPATACSRC